MGNNLPMESERVSNDEGPSSSASASALSTIEPCTSRRLRVWEVQLYRVCEDVTEVLIYLMLVFSPWAFGTTQHWSIWTMNVGGYALGALLGVKLWIRKVKGYCPARFDYGATGQQDYGATGLRGLLSSHGLAVLLATLTGALLLYCLISAVDARATYDPDARFIYHHYVKGLPASFDSTRTWFAFWSYLAMACSFWALRDWLLGKSVGEERGGKVESRKRKKGGSSLQFSVSAFPFPTRLRRLLWVLSISGGLLALEGIAQRLEGSGKLLFLIKPRVNPEGETQFGPYAYRANASQYFNLLWPVCLGFWWTLQRGEGRREKEEGRRLGRHVLLVCGVLIAACPIISTSRGGALIAVGMMVIAGLFLLTSPLLFGGGGASGRHRSTEKRQPSSNPGAAPSAPTSSSRLTLLLLAIFFTAALAIGLALGWKSLKPRMAQVAEGFETREQMYAYARPMAADYPIYGTGPGTFEPVFQLYRNSPETYWPAQLHNDWLETRITFGWVGSILIGLALVAVVARWFVRGGGIHGGRRFIVLMWIAMAGCLVHARFDFPFQIYSIEFLFLVLCAVMFTLTRKA